MVFLNYAAENLSSTSTTTVSGSSTSNSLVMPELTANSFNGGVPGTDVVNYTYGFINDRIVFLTYKSGSASVGSSITIVLNQMAFTVPQNTTDTLYFMDSCLMTSSSGNYGLIRNSGTGTVSMTFHKYQIQTGV